MHNLPGAVFRSKDARRPQSQWGDILPSAKLGLDPLYLHKGGLQPFSHRLHAPVQMAADREDKLHWDDSRQLARPNDSPLGEPVQ